MAALVLAVQGVIDYRVFLFANVGDDSEHPDTLDYVRNVAMPYAEANGIELFELERRRRDGTVETLVERIYSARRSVDIPARMVNGAPGNRKCTGDFKISVVGKWQKAHGATLALPAVVGLGISLDEFQRARTDSGIAWQVLDYPLIDLRLKREDCKAVIRGAGLPVPPKSSCYFCPFHRQSEWMLLKRTRPDLFEKAVAIEHRINEKRAEFGKDVVRLHSTLLPLESAVGDQMTLWPDGELGGCASGFCFT